MPRKDSEEPCSNSRSCKGIDRCVWTRKDAVGLFETKRILSAKEIDKALAGKGLGLSARRKSIHFLATDNACAWVKMITCRSENKALRPKIPGRMFGRRDVSDSEISETMKNCLTRYQKRLLQTFEYYDKPIHYLSLYDLRRLLPYTGRNVDFALTRLYDFRQVERVKGKVTPYYCLPKRAKWLLSHLEETELEDNLEFKAILNFHGRIMNLYPPGLLKQIEGVVRPSSPETLRITRGMSFDIVYEFTVPVQGYNFFAVDIHPRIPITEFVVQSFMRKIRRNPIAQMHGETSSDSSAEVFLEDNTFGMIVYRHATKKALKYANANDFRLIKLREAGIDYDKLKESCKSESH
jgi:hypothetical protein